MPKPKPLHDELKQVLEATRIREETEKLFANTRTENPQDDSDEARLANGAVWAAKEGERLARAELLARIRADHLPGIEISPNFDLGSFTGDGLVKLARARAREAADRTGRQTRMALPGGREVSASPKGGPLAEAMTKF